MRPDEPVVAVARIMVEDGCDAVPVVTATGIVVGLVTAADLVAVVSGVDVAPSFRTG